MLAYILVFLAAIAPNQKEFIGDKVKIIATIESNIYKYDVVNLSDSDPWRVRLRAAVDRLDHLDLLSLKSFIFNSRDYISYYARIIHILTF